MDRSRLGLFQIPGSGSEDLGDLRAHAPAGSGWPAVLVHGLHLQCQLEDTPLWWGSLAEALWAQAAESLRPQRQPLNSQGNTALWDGDPEGVDVHAFILKKKKMFLIVKAKGKIKCFHRKYEEDLQECFLRPLRSSDPV